MCQRSLHDTRGNAKKFGRYFTYRKQENAPCLKFSSPTNLYCFTNKAGALKKCQCYDDSEHYDNKWCNQDLYGKDHTMCRFEDGAQSSCGTVISRGITTKADKEEIVNKHNQLRAKIANGKEQKGVDGSQPKAANMRQMVWNDQLAEVAQRWADQCKPTPHDKNRRTDEFSYVGQNYAWKSSSNPKRQKYLLKGMVKMWYNEVKDVFLEEVKHFVSTTPVTGHYTQVAWAKTYEVGCGFISSVKRNGRNVESVLICNYGPGGNALNAPQYTIGQPGSECPFGTKKTIDGLCA